jgi:hypothetical protein
MRVRRPDGEVLEITAVSNGLADDYRAGGDRADAAPEQAGEAARESATERLSPIA